MNNKIYEFKAVIKKVPDIDGAYVEVPVHIKEEFGKGRILVHATFDNEPYDGQIMKMGTEEYIIEIRKDIRNKISRQHIYNNKRKRECKMNDDNKTYKTIDEYMLIFPENIRIRLSKVREALKDTLPDAKEKISWNMPTYWDKHNIIHFAAYKNHIGLYPGEEAIIYFAERLKDYKTSKGAIQFQYDEPIPLELISDIAKWCYETGNHH